MVRNDWVWIDHKRIALPDEQISITKQEHTYKAMNGYGHTLAVFENNKPIGWISSEKLGYESVKDWMKENE